MEWQWGPTCFTDEQVVEGTKEPRTVALLAMAWSNSRRSLNVATLTEMGISDEEERRNHVQRSTVGVVKGLDPKSVP